MLQSFGRDRTLDPGTQGGTSEAAYCELGSIGCMKSQSVGLAAVRHRMEILPLGWSLGRAGGHE